MTIKQINKMVEDIGLPFDYYAFPQGTGQAPPYITWFLGRDNDFIADNKNYCDIERLFIELYTSERDFDLESQVEEVLKAHDLVAHKESERIDSESMQQTSWEMEVIINEG